MTIPRSTNRATSSPAAGRFAVTYRVRCPAADIAARARAIAVEQSVEMPVGAIADRTVRDDIVGEVLDISPCGSGPDAAPGFDVRIGLALATTGLEAGQLLNMAFGNTSIHADVVLQDIEIPKMLAEALGGPGHGLAGLRERVGAGKRALTCSALKPQGLPPGTLAAIAEALALGGIDYIKDDHGLADQDYAPFAARVAACAAAVHRAAARTGRPTRYVPSLTGDLDALRAQAAIARDAGLDTVMLAPMISGVSNLQALRRGLPGLAVMAHPSLGGAGIAPDLLIGKLFRLLGADAVVFPNHGGRFGYTPSTCRALAGAATGGLHGLRPALPVPAGGMTLERVPEMLDFYGPDVMLLIGGSLLEAGDRLTEAAAAFARAVAGHPYGATT